MAYKKPKILLHRESDEDILKRLLPTRARIAISVYDHQQPGGARFYRHLSTLHTIAPVYTKRELLTLWHAIETLIESGSWHDERARDAGDRLPAAVGAAPPTP